RRCATRLGRQDLVRSPLRLAERPSQHRLGVVHREDERLRRAELPRARERRTATVLEENRARPGGREDGDSHLRERLQLDVPDLERRGGDRGGRKSEERHRREQYEARFHAAPSHDAADRSTPFVLSFDRKPGRRLVGSSGAMTRPALAPPSGTWAQKMSCRVITSPSMPAISVIWMIFRDPSTSREMCTSRSKPPAICS